MPGFTFHMGFVGGKFRSSDNPYEQAGDMALMRAFVKCVAFSCRFVIPCAKSRFLTSSFLDFTLFFFTQLLVDFKGDFYKRSFTIGGSHCRKSPPFQVVLPHLEPHPAAFTHRKQHFRRNASKQGIRRGECPPESQPPPPPPAPLVLKVKDSAFIKNLSFV